MKGKLRYNSFQERAQHLDAMTESLGTEAAYILYRKNLILDAYQSENNMALILPDNERPQVKGGKSSKRGKDDELFEPFLNVYLSGQLDLKKTSAPRKNFTSAMEFIKFSKKWLDGKRSYGTAKRILVAEGINISKSTYYTYIETIRNIWSKIIYPAS